MDKYTKKELLDMPHEQLAEVCSVAIQAIDFERLEREKQASEDLRYSKQLKQWSFDRAMTILGYDKETPPTLEAVLNMAELIKQEFNDA